jgi:NAD(P)H-nitrite reductase large subunit
MDSVWMKSVEWYETNRITLKTGVSATTLDATAKVVTLGNGEQIHYDKLLIASGTHNRNWQIKGAEKKGVHYLRTLDHAQSIIADLAAGKKHAVMVGSACVTYEIADILHSKGVSITEVMRENYFWQPALSQEESALVEGRLLERGVTLIRDMEIVEVLGEDAVTGVRLKDGRDIPCDMVFAFIGVDVSAPWLLSSGMELSRGVLTNEYLETSLPDVWAAGDVARFHDVVLDDTVMMGNWMNATKQGETAALNMLGDKKIYELVSFHSSHGFGDMISFAGDGRALPDRTYIMRGDAGARAVGRIIMRGNHIVGASLVNRTQELATIVKLITLRTDVSSKKSELADAHFDLKTLLPKP